MLNEMFIDVYFHSLNTLLNEIDLQTVLTAELDTQLNAINWNQFNLFSFLALRGQVIF